MEIYKGIKNDPLYRHYLHTHLAYFAETAIDMTANLPFSIKGIVNINILNKETKRLY